MPFNPCPTNDELTQYTLGILSDEAVPDLELHLETCPGCSETLELLETKSDHFTRLLREPSDSAPHDFFDEELCRGTIEAISHFAVSDIHSGFAGLSTTPQSNSHESNPRAGQRLGQFLLLEMVGKGGMGLVFRARHEKLDKIVAVKVLSAARMHEPRMRERFHREMQAAGKIEHPHVVRAMYSDESDGLPFLVMEFVDGVNLSALLKSHGPFSIEVACALIRQAGLGLQQIHQAGMVHRDLKPGNLMLASDGQVKVMDLGLALLYEHFADGADGLTLSGQVMGTVDYMAPEQADDTHSVDARADIYGLGATLFALLTGRSPLGDKKQTLLKKLSLLATKPAPSLREFLPDAPVELADVVSRMLARHPDLRFSNVQDVIDALTPFSNGESLPELLTKSAMRGNEDTCSDFVDCEQETVILDRKTQANDEFAAQSTNLESEPTEFAVAGSNRNLRSLASPLIIVCLLVTGFLVWNHKRQPLNHAEQRSVLPIEVVENQSDIPEKEAAQVSKSISPLQELSNLLKTGELSSNSDGAWSVFSHDAAPDMRTEAIHTASQLLPVTALLKKLQNQISPSVRAGLLLALSEYEKEVVFRAAMAANGSDEETFLKSLYFAYVNDPDSEVHACLEFLLRGWEQKDMLWKLRPLLEQKLIPFDGGWYQPLHVSAMVVVPGPVESRIGSPPDESGRILAPDQNEDLRTVSIPYTFAICSTEVTRYQYWRLSDRYWELSSPANPDVPVNAIPWRAAVEFCNRLSELEGIPPAEHCYYTTEGPDGIIWLQKENALELTGYRLPTDEEWEIACRAGTSTVRPFGEETTWLREYIRGEQPAGDRLEMGSLKPNPLGLFDMLGNVAEWIHSEPAPIDTETGIRRARGGSAWTQASGLRSAARYVFENTSPKVGFRVARTLVQRPYRDSSGSERLSEIIIEVGPPSCPDELAAFVDQSFQPLRNQQVISLGNWNVRDVPTRKFRVWNPTDKDIDLDQLPWMSNLFAFAPPPAQKISAGGTAEFGIRMNVVGVGERRHDLHFKWGKPLTIDVTEFDFPPIRLHGCLEGSLLEVMGVGIFGSAAKPIDLGTVPVGSSAGKTFFVINIGNKAVEADVIDVSPPFSVSSPLDGSIIPHMIEKSFRIQTDTTIPGLHKGHVSLRTREQKAVEFTFPTQVVVSELEGFSALGVFRKGTWLVDHNRDGKVDEEIVFGAADGRPLTGDWNGDGICDLAVWHVNSEGQNLVQLKSRGINSPPLEKSEIFLPAGALRPVAADRDGDGRTEIGYLLPVPERNSMVWRFDTAHDGEFSDRVAFGQPNDDPVIGDWNGDGLDDIAVSRPANLIAPGARMWQMTWNGLDVPRELIYLSPLDAPLAGDWDADGDDDPGGWRPVAEPGLCVWQFETDGDGHSNNELEGFGCASDIPVILRNRSR